MPLPESMSRIVIVGTKSHMDEVTDALYKINAVHLIDHTVDADEGFSIGVPRPYSEKASERLLALKAAEKDLGIRPKKAKFDPIEVSDIESQISSNTVESVHAEVMKAVDEKNKIDQKITETKALKENLEKLSKLSIDLELYKGYESLTVFVGTVKSNPSKALDAIDGLDYELSMDKTGGVIAVFAKNEVKDKVSSALSDFGYMEIAVPNISGSAKDALANTNNEIEKLTADYAAASENIQKLSEKYKPFIVASDEQLSLTVEKGELPLRIATSEFSFVIDGWIPTAQIEKVQNDLNSLLGDKVYMEVQETRGRKLSETEAQEPRFQPTPTKCKNGNLGKKFEYAVSLVSVPKYQEIDPATLVSIFFPFFFGFMVGDFGYAIPFICLGLYGMLRAKSKDFKSIGTVLFFGGIWAAIFGFFFFGEMFGMHFASPISSDPMIVEEYLKTNMTWEHLWNLQLPDWFKGMLFTSDVMETNAEGVKVLVTHYGIGKLAEVTFLLKLSVYIGVVHLFIAYLVGFINAKRQHGLKEGYLEKGGWIFSFAGLTLFCYALTEVLFKAPPPGGTIADNMTQSVLIMLLVGLAIMIIGVISCYPREKAQAVLELPGIVGNILSYTRLAAIGMSKAGMALAFNYIAFIMFPQYGPLSIIASAVVFAIGHLMIWVLAILSAGLHGLRLQYVESMNKFFVGGGTLFNPLSIKRKHTKNSKENVEA